MVQILNPYCPIREYTESVDNHLAVRGDNTVNCPFNWIIKLSQHRIGYFRHRLEEPDRPTTQDKRQHDHCYDHCQLPPERFN